MVASTHPTERSHLISNRAELAVRSITEGFLGLVFEEWTAGNAMWPTAVQRRFPGSRGGQLVEGAVQGLVEVPESFKMDIRRIKDFQWVSSPLSHDLG